MTYREWPNPGRYLTEDGQIPEDDLPRMAKSRKISYRGWPNPGRYLTENGQISEDILPRMAKSRKMTYREWPNLGRYLNENGQIREDDLPRFAKFLLMTSRNRPGPRTSVSVIWARICKDSIPGSLSVYKFCLFCHRQVNLQNFNRGFFFMKPAVRSHLTGTNDFGLSQAETRRNFEIDFPEF